MLSALPSRLNSLFARALVRQPFRKETGDGATILTREGDIYKLQGVLGTGGMSTVYKANRFRDDGEFAVKVATSTQRHIDAARSLRKESKMLSSLDHPSIVKVIEHGDTKECEPFMVMELIKGVPLDQIICTQAPLSFLQGAGICLAVADALIHVHANGIIHRDVKPSNILVSTDPEKDVDTVKLLDFGIAIYENEADQSAEGSSGSLLYVSPEQLIRGGCSVRSDVFQLGLLLFECLTGKLPFEISVAGAMAYRRGELPLVPEEDVIQFGITPDIRNLLESSLALFPKHRPASAKAFASKLRHCVLEYRKQQLSQTA